MIVLIICLHNTATYLYYKLKVQKMMPIEQEHMYAYSSVSTIMRDYKLKNTRNAITTTTHAKSARIMWNRLCGTERDFAKENGLPAAYLANEQFKTQRNNVSRNMNRIEKESQKSLIHVICRWWEWKAWWSTHFSQISSVNTTWIWSCNGLKHNTIAQHVITMLRYIGWLLQSSTHWHDFAQNLLIEQYINHFGNSMR